MEENETWPFPNPMKEESTKSTFSPVYNKDFICEHFKQQQISEGVPDVIEFRQPLSPHRRLVDPPVLSLFCNDIYFLTKSVVYFTIEVHNLPPDVQIDTTMFDAAVTDPLDGNVACIICKNANSNFHSFNGSFCADEDGFYKIRVRLVA
ncbi:unnamed protein product [Orchesella dallaii]|uniref:Uncharacterized protein n=1 Tax=Orchesella dallaii TaxID=48710 RepID=A0ABP1PVV2_9HEXA